MIPPHEIIVLKDIDHAKSLMGQEFARTILAKLTKLPHGLTHGLTNKYSAALTIFSGDELMPTKISHEAGNFSSGFLIIFEMLEEEDRLRLTYGNYGYINPLFMDSIINSVHEDSAQIHPGQKLCIAFIGLLSRLAKWDFDFSTHKICFKVGKYDPTPLSFHKDDYILIITNLTHLYQLMKLNLEGEKNETFH